MKHGFRIKKLDAYLLSELTGPFVGGIFFFIFIFLSFQTLRLAEFFVVHEVPLKVLGEMVLLMALSFTPMALPISFLISVLMGFGRLSSDSELTAIKACGVSLKRMTVPVLGFAALVAALSLVLNLEWVPAGETRSRALLNKVSNTKVVSAVKEGAFTSGFFDLLLFADEVDSGSNELKRVFIFDDRDSGNPMSIIAQEGRLLPAETEGDLGAAAVLHLRDGNIHQHDLNEEVYQRTDFENYYLHLEIGEGREEVGEKPKYFAHQELQKKIRESEAGSEDRRRFQTEFWRRLGIAMSPFIFAFLGMGFGTIRTRSIRAGATLITIVVVLTYWLIQAYASSAAHAGLLPPFVAMQLPNLILLCIGVEAYRRANW